MYALKKTMKNTIITETTIDAAPDGPRMMSTIGISAIFGAALSALRKGLSTWRNLTSVLRSSPTPTPVTMPIRQPKMVARSVVQM